MRRIARIETDISEIVGGISVDFGASCVSFLMIKTSRKEITLPEPYFHSVLDGSFVICTLNKELHDLYSSPSIIRIIKSRRMRWTGNVARMGEKRNAYRLLVRKPEGKRPLGRPRRRWVYNIRMDLGEVGWSDVD
jgi:hypothetical protein